MTELSEYEAGKHLKIKIADHRDAIYTVKIEEAFTPFTMSAVLLVSLRKKNESPVSFGNDTPKLTILKLHDRRIGGMRHPFARRPDYREEEQMAYREYLSGIRSGEIQLIDFGDPLKTYNAIGGFPPAQMEGYLNYMVRQQYDAELAAYQRLAELQGTLIPRL